MPVRSTKHTRRAKAWPCIWARSLGPRSCSGEHRQMRHYARDISSAGRDSRASTQGMPVGVPAIADAHSSRLYAEATSACHPLRALNSPPWALLDVRATCHDLPEACCELRRSELALNNSCPEHYNTNVRSKRIVCFDRQGTTWQQYCCRERSPAELGVPVSPNACLVLNTAPTHTPQNAAKSPSNRATVEVQ